MVRFRITLVALLCCGGSAAAQSEVTLPAFEPAANAHACRGDSGYAADFEGRRTFLWRPVWLEAIAADPALRSEALEEAEEALGRGPYTVTDKVGFVPGAGMHDYASIGPYWWPDSQTVDGMPYQRRDGQVNPARDGPEFDKARLRALSQDLRALSLGYYFAKDERFADHAAALVRAWFLDPATKMAPHFDFAQGIPGRVDGRGEGIIEASHLSTIVEALGLLQPSSALTSDDRLGLREWYRDFVVWMATSKNGAEELRKTNNHGVFYDFYLAHFALFAGAPEVAGNVVSAFPEYRIGVQMDRQGRFIAELRRTRSWHYAHYVLDGAARLATIGECLELDLWSAQLPDGRSLSVARNFLLRYSETPARWPFQDIDLSKGHFDRMQAEADQLSVFFQKKEALRSLNELP